MSSSPSKSPFGDGPASVASGNGSDDLTYASGISLPQQAGNPTFTRTEDELKSENVEKSTVDHRSNQPDEKQKLSTDAGIDNNPPYHVAFQSRDFSTNGNTDNDEDLVPVDRMPSYRQKNLLGGIGFHQNFGEPTHVDYDEANAQFQSAQRTLSKRSDLGKAEEEAGLPFDIREYLTQKAENLDEDRFKRMGVLFEHLTVIGSGSGRAYIGNVFSPIWNVLKSVPVGLGNIVRGKGFHGDVPTKTILHDVNGYCGAGEMMLVLGKPGAGCSTLLRVLGNHRKTYHQILGDVTYGGMSAKEVQKHYRGEVVYNQEEDYHYPTLSVRKTIDFALKSRTVSRRVLENREEVREEVLELLIKMFGLQKCADTIVGDRMLRGVSGGEKKRTSIAEQMATTAAVTIWDGSTRGLDASSALDYVRSLRIMTDLFKRTTVVTLYQASENIYNLFDKVLLLAEGRCIYFGRADQAKAYFENLGYVCPGRQTTSDFLTGITMKHEARIAPGMEDVVPRTPEAFEASYRQSTTFEYIQQEMEAAKEETKVERPDEAFRQTVETSRMGAASSKFRRKSPYQTTYWFQIGTTLRREVDLLLGSMGQLIFRYAYNAVMAVIVGSLFYQLPPNTTGAFTRGGALFFALLFNTLMANAEIPKSFGFRPIVYKQKAFAFYHPSTQYIAQTIADLPLYLVQVIIFSVILYWMVGLQAEAGKFFFFLLVLYVTCLCLTAMFRMIGAISKDVNVAHVLSGVFLMFYINLTGYLIPPKAMGGWVIWIYYINPIAYGLKALLSNEFRGMNMECMAPSLIPYGDEKYNDINHQVCTLLGSKPANRFVRGEDYLSVGYGFEASDMWIDFIAVVCFWILFMLITAVVTEKLEFGKGGYSTNVFKATRTKPINFEAAQPDGGYENVAVKEQGEEELPSKAAVHGTSLIWNNVDYMVPGKKKGAEIQLLHEIFGYVKPGTMTALMGASGAGKTTLLDVLAQRKNVGRVEGEILMNGAPLTKLLRRKTGYCEQMDVHEPYSTVREALRFSAYLRQPKHVSKKEKDQFVERVIHLLEMEDIADAMVGTLESGIGLSMEERKRLTIGVELVAKPKVLFLDEPTSGLDAQASFSIVRFLRKLALAGQSILCTIHQPSSLLFEQFDRLLLLAPGGRTVYFGELGSHANAIIDYFESHGAPACPPDANPAEYILDVIGLKGDIDWPETYNNSDLAKRERQILAEFVEAEKAKDRTSDDPDEHKEFALGYFAQTRVVLKRTFVSYWRDAEYNMNRFLLQVMVGIMLGLCFLRLGHSSQDLQNRVMAVFQTSIMGILIINQVEPQLALWRTWFSREEASGMYDWKSFATGMFVTEVPFVIFAATLFFLVFYWMVNMTDESSRTGFFYLILIAYYLFSVTFGFLVASWTPSDVIAAMINPFPTSLLFLMCGVTIPYAAMPKFWRSWVYWANPYHYYIEGIIANDLYDQAITCKDEEYLTFVPPTGQTCGEYAKEFLAIGPGYIKDLSATSNCLYCPYKVGQEFTNSLDWSYDNKW
ncbi:ATP-binding cassette transporter snq2, partial [Dispira simplex]